jgi:hypothetical protein
VEKGYEVREEGGGESTRPAGPSLLAGLLLLLLHLCSLP